MNAYMKMTTSHLTIDSDYQKVKLVVLGAPGVGKSSIISTCNGLQDRVCENKATFPGREIVYKIG